MLSDRRSLGSIPSSKNHIRKKDQETVYTSKAVDTNPNGETGSRIKVIMTQKTKITEYGKYSKA